MSTRKIRWGILGVAKINDRILPSFARTTHTELRAIASRSAEKAATAAACAGIPVAHGSYEALLNDPEIDVIYNPLPNTLHAEWTMKAAERGKHILCEKPLAETAEEAQKMVDFCAEKKVQLLDGFMWPHHPRTARLRHLLDQGAIGEVQRVVGTFTFQLPMDPANIRLQPQLGGGSLLDVGCYPVYGIRWALASEPVKVFATAKMEFGVDVLTSAQLWFADGRTASFDCGFVLPFRGWLEMVGSAGVIRVPQMWVPGQEADFEIQRAEEPSERITIAGEDQIAHMLDNFSRAVLTGQPATPSPQEGVRTLRVLDAIARSARSGQVERV